MYWTIQDVWEHPAEGHRPRDQGYRGGQGEELRGGAQVDGGAVGGLIVD